MPTQLASILMELSRNILMRLNPEMIFQLHSWTLVVCIQLLRAYLDIVVTCRPMARVARVWPALIVTATTVTAQSQLHEYTTSTNLARNVQHTTYKMLALSSRPGPRCTRSTMGRLAIVYMSWPHHYRYTSLSASLRQLAIFSGKHVFLVFS